MKKKKNNTRKEKLFNLEPFVLLLWAFKMFIGIFCESFFLLLLLVVSSLFLLLLLLLYSRHLLYNLV